MALTASQIAEMYETAKRVHEGAMATARAIDLLERSGVSRARAADCIQNYRRMRRGERYTRTLTGATTAHFLDRLGVDFPEDGLEKGLAALWAHIEYLEPIRRGACRQERELHEQFSSRLPVVAAPIYPDEVLPPETDDRKFLEGATRQVLINQYERDPRARSACIRHWGTACYVCGFDFQKAYGDMGRGFIHVHHLTDIASIGAQYEVDPRADLRPVCPNCHAMLHTRRPAMNIDELKSMLAARRTG
ncbi:HNH endonuclease [Paraburkholderia fungorum]|uniref:HNH endonuclease n=1 Tax=Paraburkholderia fungorum TaxID=134537 RepID=UPI0009DFCE7D|nr:HNH endonuclease [Paraburkholderia fungorum]USX08236.1 HNH endonuclease [Paraburkholderia fungorum]